MNSGCFTSGLFMLDRLSHLKGGVPAGGGGLLPAWHNVFHNSLSSAETPSASLVPLSGGTVHPALT